MRMLIIAALAAVALPGVAQAAAFTNGGFEDGTDPGAFNQLNAGDATSIPGWVVTGGSVDYIGTYWTPGEGARSVDLSGSGAGTIAQTFDTDVGQSYLVSFLIAGNPAGDPTIKSLDVSVGGAATTYTFDTTGASLAAMNWTPQTYAFTATGTSTTLSFASGVSTAYGAALDGVSVAAVPETATWAMMIGGFGFIGGALRRRRTIGAFAHA